jgi:hypothetical protein
MNLDLVVLVEMLTHQSMVFHYINHHYHFHHLQKHKIRVKVLHYIQLHLHLKQFLH